MTSEPRTNPDDAHGDERYHPDDGCPLFSERLEDHILAVIKGAAPNRGTFCGECYTPLGATTAVCPHCGTVTAQRAPVERVPGGVIAMLQRVRRTERWIVNAMAYLGLTIAVVAGLALVLAVPYLRHHLLAATIVYTIVLIIGGRSLAGVIGGYYGDQIAYARARRRLLTEWRDWVAARG